MARHERAPVMTWPGPRGWSEELTILRGGSVGHGPGQSLAEILPEVDAPETSGLHTPPERPLNECAKLCWYLPRVVQSCILARELGVTIDRQNTEGRRLGLTRG